MFFDLHPELIFTPTEILEIKVSGGRISDVST